MTRELTEQQKIELINQINDETLNIEFEPRLYRIQRYIELYEKKVKELG